MNNCKVTIFGDSYSLVMTEEESHVSQAAHLVDATMKEIAVKSTSANAKKIAILAALQIASKLLQQESKHAAIKRHEEHILAILNKELSV